MTGVLHHSSSSSLISCGGIHQPGIGGGGLVYAEGLDQLQNIPLHQQRPHQLPLTTSHSEVNGGGGVAAVQVTREVKKWNPFEDSFTQMAEDHLFGQEFDKIRQQGSQTSE